jgi:hypothetical protein
MENSKKTVHDRQAAIDSRIESLANDLIAEIGVVDADILFHLNEAETHRTEALELKGYREKLEQKYSIISGRIMEGNPNISSVTSRSVIKNLARGFNTYDDIQSRDLNIEVNRFWRQDGFPGWKIYLRDLMESENRFISIYDVVTEIGLTDTEEKNRIQSAVNNALSISLRDAKIAAVMFEEPKRRYYGLHSFFHDEWPKNEYIDDLQNRLEIDSLKIVDVIYKTTPSMKVKDITDRYNERMVDSN